MDPNFLPIPTIKGEFGYKRADINIDSTNIPQNSGKIVTTGIRREKYLVKCNGNGGFSFEKIQSKEDTLNELSKLKKKKIDY